MSIRTKGSAIGDCRGWALFAIFVGVCLTGALVAAAGRAEREAVLLVRLDRSAYSSKEPVQITLEVSNKSSQEIHLTFPTSQRFDLSLEDEGGREIWRWSQGHSFLQMLGEEVLQPGDGALRYRETIPAPAVPGRYKLVAWISSKDRPLKAATFFEVR